MLKHYLKITFRTIRKEKFRYIITTLGISVGIVIFSAVLLIVDGIKSNFTEIPNAENLYKFAIARQLPDGEENTMFGLSAEHFREINKLSMPDIEKIGLISVGFNQLYICNSDDENKLFQARRSEANSEILDLLDIEFIEGGVSKDTKANNQVIITDRYSKLLFGTTKSIGNKVSVYNNDNDFIGSYDVIGVIKKPNTINYAYMFDFIIPDNFEEETNVYVNSIVTLKKSFDIERVNATLKTYKINMFGDGSSETDSYAKLVPYMEDRMNPPKVLIAGWLIMGGMVLSISLFSFVNLLISSMQARVRQFSLRKIVGAQSWAFVSMIILEILPVILISILLSYFLLELLVYLSSISSSALFGALFNDIFKQIFTYPFKIGFWMLIGSVVLSFIMSKRLQKIVLTQGLRGEAFSLGKNRGRNVLLVIELMLTLIFINTSVYLITSAFNSVPKQYQPLSKAQSKAALYVPLDRLDLISKNKEIRDRIKSISGVTEIVDEFPLGSFHTNTELSDRSYNVRTDNMFENYAEFWGLDDPIYKRELAPHEAIINREFADKLMPDDRNSFKLGSQEYNVVGVVDEIPLTEIGNLSALLGTKQSYGSDLNNIFVKCDPKSKDRVQKEIMNIIREYLPATIDYRINSLNDIFNIQVSMLKMYAVIMLIASLFSIVITVLGIYSSITYDTNRKRKEIAIRKINGASRKNILMFISKAYMFFVLIAGVLASLLHRLVIVKMFNGPDTINFKYSILFDIAILLLITLVITAIVSFKIRKAMSENPSEVIKSE